MGGDWFTSDLHFGHTNIIDYCGRPYASADEMNEDLVRRWNAVVGAEDTVYVLGDICMGRLDDTLKCIGELAGKKLLVPGNHDRMFGCQGTKWRHAADRYEAAGIEVLEDQVEMAIDSLPVMLCHFPYSGDSRDDGHEDRYQDHRPVDRGGRLLHGHTHGKWRKKGRMIDVGVDAWAGTPVSRIRVAEVFKSPEQWLDPLPWEMLQGNAHGEVLHH